MNCTCNHTHIAPTINGVLRGDPTRTLTLRRAFEAQMLKRFAIIKQAIIQAVDTDDVFGLRERRPIVLQQLGPRQFEFLRSDQKIKGFMDWLKEMERKHILTVTYQPGVHQGEQPWTNYYIQSAYQRGMNRARQELRKKGYNVPRGEGPLRQDSIGVAFNQPFHAERVAMVYTRVYSELEGITSAMDQQISRVLALGMAEGRNPYDIARDITGRVDAIGLNRARTLARTEVVSAHHQATINEYEQWGVHGVSVVAEWMTAGFGVCPICQKLARGGDIGPGIYSLNKIRNMIPVHPNCLLDGQVKVYASQGWVPISKIEVGDLVLSHKGKFQKVTHVHKTPKQTPEAVRIFLQGKNNQQMSLSLTDNHPILIGGDWTEVQNVKIGDEIWYLADKCARCGKLVPYHKKYCSQSCLSKDITDRQWGDESHRKNMSAKAKEQMKREYASGIRQKDKITKNANKAVRELAKEGKFVLQRPEVRDKIRQVTNTPEMRKASSIRMTENNPTKSPEVRNRHSEYMKALYAEFPEKHPNRIMTKKGHMTYIERRMKSLLDELDLEYESQVPVDRFFIDFGLSKLKIAIECDGEYWHQDARKDFMRQRRIERQGWTVLRFSGSRINKDLPGIRDELLRVLSNHANQFNFIPLQVKDIKKWKVVKAQTLWNLSVENDESYVANGFVVHNCRCVALPMVKEN